MTLEYNREETLARLDKSQEERDEAFAKFCRTMEDKYQEPFHGQAKEFTDDLKTWFDLTITNTRDTREAELREQNAPYIFIDNNETIAPEKLPTFHVENFTMNKSTVARLTGLLLTKEEIAALLLAKHHENNPSTTRAIPEFTDDLRLQITVAQGWANLLKELRKIYHDIEEEGKVSSENYEKATGVIETINSMRENGFGMQQLRLNTGQGETKAD